MVWGSTLKLGKFPETLSAPLGTRLVEIYAILIKYLLLSFKHKPLSPELCMLFCWEGPQEVE